MNTAFTRAERITNVTIECVAVALLLLFYVLLVLALAWMICLGIALMSGVLQ